MRAKLATSLLLVSAALAANAAGGGARWGYEGHGPAAWGEVPGAEACKLGKMQSPIDIRGAKKAALPPLDLADGGFMNVGGVPYKLVQFHFHAPSEEKVEGKGYPMVVHLVHRADDGRLAVIALLLKEGNTDAALAPKMNARPVQPLNDRTVERS